MKRTFDLDAAMKVSNVTQHEHNEIRLKLCNQTVVVEFTKKQMEKEIPTFRLKFGDYHQRMALDIYDEDHVLLPHEPGLPRYIEVGVSKETEVLEEGMEEPQAGVCSVCGNSGVFFYKNMNKIERCEQCNRFTTNEQAWAFVRKVFNTVIRNGGG